MIPSDMSGSDLRILQRLSFIEMHGVSLSRDIAKASKIFGRFFP
ncbi:MAG: hypothetical protein ACYDAZ_00635 [Thermoplasmataceae archaeon]